MDILKLFLGVLKTMNGVVFQLLVVVQMLSLKLALAWTRAINVAKPVMSFTLMKMANGDMKTLNGVESRVPVKAFKYLSISVKAFNYLSI